MFMRLGCSRPPAATLILQCTQDAAAAATTHATELESGLAAANAELAVVREQLAAATAAVTAATAAASDTDGSNAAAAAAAAAKVVQLQGLLAERDAQVEHLQAQVGALQQTTHQSKHFSGF